MQNQNQPVIEVRGVKKEYRIGSIGGRTLQKDLQSWWAKKRGKEDPNVPVFVDQRLIGERFMALNGVDLTVRKGERLGIIGVNGAGKSTLLKLLSRVTAPSEGDIYLYGRVSSMLEVGTGFHGEMTGRENVYMNGMILGMSRAEIDERMEDIIEFSEVREFIDTPVKRYSSGMFVKLAFSVAAHLNSEIMIMDEVLAVGDMAFQNKCLAKMRAAADEDGRTILYVSHNMDTIRKLCDRCVVMDQGKIIFDGDVDSAVAIYMNSGLGSNGVEVSLADAAHLGIGQKVGTADLRMTYLKLVDKILPEYDDGENIRLSVTVDVRQPVKDVMFRMTLRNDGDVSIGTAWSSKMSFEAGSHTVDISFPQGELVKGSFYASVGFYREDELGHKIMLDHVERAIKLKFTGNLAWFERAYGYVNMPEGSVEVRENRDSLGRNNSSQEARS